MPTGARDSLDSGSAERAGGGPVRVLVLADSPYAGGITSHILTLAEASRGAPGVDVLLATLPGRRDDRTLIERCAAEGIPLWEVPMRGRLDAGVWRRIRAFVRSEQIDVIHTHNYRASLICAPLAGAIPIVNTCHGQVAEPGARLRVYQRLELFAMRRHAATIACSGFVRDWLIEKGLRADRIHVVPNAVADPLARGQGAAVSREVLGVPEDALLLLYVGRLARGKGLPELTACVRARDDVAAVIVGDGPMRDELEASAAGLPVRFAGRQNDPGPWYAAADVVVLASEMEAMPMTLLEAAAWGRPVAATRAGGIPEIVEDGVTGALVARPEDIGAGVDRLRDSDVRAAVGRAARARWERLFAPERMMARLSAVYAAAAGRGTDRQKRDEA